MSVIVRIKYVSEENHTEITANGNILDTSRIDGKNIEEWVYPFIIKGIRWFGIYHELVNFCQTDKISVRFDGDNESLEILKTAFKGKEIKISGNNKIVIMYQNEPLLTKIIVNGKNFDTARISDMHIDEWINPSEADGLKWDGIFKELENFIECDEYSVQFTGKLNDMFKLMETCPENVDITYRSPSAMKPENKPFPNFPMFPPTNSNNAGNPPIPDFTPPNPNNAMGNPPIPDFTPPNPNNAMGNPPIPDFTPPNPNNAMGNPPIPDFTPPNPNNAMGNPPIPDFTPPNPNNAMGNPPMPDFAPPNPNNAMGNPYMPDFPAFQQPNPNGINENPMQNFPPMQQQPNNFDNRNNSGMPAPIKNAFDKAKNFNADSVKTAFSNGVQSVQNFNVNNAMQSAKSMTKDDWKTFFNKNWKKILIFVLAVVLFATGIVLLINLIFGKSKTIKLKDDGMLTAMTCTNKTPAGLVGYNYFDGKVGKLYLKLKDHTSVYLVESESGDEVEGMASNGEDYGRQAPYNYDIDATGTDKDGDGYVTFVVSIFTGDGYKEVCTIKGEAK